MTSNIPRPESLLADAAVASRILVQQQVLDVFGHIAVRDPKNPEVFWLSAAMPPSVVRAEDMLPFDLEGRVLVPTDAALFSERFIHAAIFAARSDVMAVCHHHADAIMPFCLGGPALRALSQTGAFLGTAVPVWDSRDRFGDTAMLVNVQDQAADLAATLGGQSAALMRGHGMIVAGSGVRDLTFRCVHACKEAAALATALQLGPVTGLSPGEIAAVGQPAVPAVARAWTHWTALLGKTAE